MIDTNKLKIAQEWIEKLANGINPLTSEPVKEDDIINNVHISRCLFYVNEILAQIQTPKSTTNKQKAFRMSTAEAEQIAVLNPCGIAEFTRAVSINIPSDMKPLSASVVIKWLRNQGYLYEVNVDDKHKTNLPTEEGNKIGITVSIQQAPDGREYKRVIYSILAQRFMLNNIESIVSNNKG